MNLRFSLPRQRLAKLLAVPVAIGVFWAFFSLGASCQRGRRADELLRRFAQHPDQQTADQLADLLDRQRVSRSQGEVILRTLLTPQVTVRDAYPMGGPAYLSASFPFELRFRRLYLKTEEGVDGKDARDPGMRWVPSNTAGSFDVSSAGTAPKNHLVNLHPREYQGSNRGFAHVVLRGHYSLILPRREKRGWVTDDPPAYACSVAIGADMLWLPREESDQVFRRSNPELNKAMAALLAVKKLSCCRGRDPVTGGYMRIRGLVFPALPENIAFRAAFRPAGGAEIPLPGFRGCHRAGMPGSLELPLADIKIPAGTRQGTIILRPDEDLAYPDCAIKTIWGGSIEFPITFGDERAPGK